MSDQLIIPRHLFPLVVHGAKIAASILRDGGETDAGQYLSALAAEWAHTLEFYDTFPASFKASDAASLRAVLVEATEYVLTNNYGDDVYAESFPKDWAFARRADEILSYFPS
jgi:hypothetical protein